jgi:hypothetical protein
MVKVLKSFDSAHSAVNWMTQNRIEDASIEMTGTLKSLGVVKVPSGNYHVVLKGRLTPEQLAIVAPYRGPRDLDAMNTSEVHSIYQEPLHSPWIQAQYGKGHPAHSLSGAYPRLTPEQIARNLDGDKRGFQAGLARETPAITAAGGLVDGSYVPRDVKAPTHEALQASHDAALDDNKRFELAQVGLEQSGEEERESHARTLAKIMGPIGMPAGVHRSVGMQSISREDLVTIVTKSVIDVLKTSMGRLANDAIAAAERDKEHNDMFWRGRYDGKTQSLIEDQIDKQEKQLLANRPGNKTREERVARLRAAVNERLQEAYDTITDITDQDGGGPWSYS